VINLASPGDHPAPAFGSLFRDVQYLTVMDPDTWYPILAATGRPVYLHRLSLESWVPYSAGSLWVYLFAPGEVPSKSVLPDPKQMLISRWIAGADQQSFPIRWESPAFFAPLYIPQGWSIQAAYHNDGGASAVYCENLYWA
jgi:hypothetical protein